MKKGNHQHSRRSWIRYRRPLAQPLRNARHTWTHREGYLLREISPKGEASYAEACPLPFFGLEEPPLEPFLEDWKRERSVDGPPSLRFALACLQGLVSQGSGPVASSALLPAGEAALEELPGLLAKGFRTFKWKVGVLSAPQEQELLQRLMEMGSGDAVFRLDANGHWGLSGLKAWEGFLGRHPVEYVEEPGGIDTPDAKGGVAVDYPVPLALDESLLGEKWKQWWNARWNGFWVIKPSLWGDPAEWWSTLGGEGVREKVIFSSALETVIGWGHIVTLAARLNNGRAHGLGIGSFFSEQEPGAWSDKPEYHWNREWINPAREIWEYYERCG